MQNGNLPLHTKRLARPPAVKDKYNFFQKFFMWTVMLFCVLIFGPFGLLMMLFAAFEIHSKVKEEDPSV